MFLIHFHEIKRNLCKCCSAVSFYSWLKNNMSQLTDSNYHCYENFINKTCDQCQGWTASARLQGLEDLNQTVLALMCDIWPVLCLHFRRYVVDILLNVNTTLDFNPLTKVFSYQIVPIPFHEPCNTCNVYYYFKVLCTLDCGQAFLHCNARCDKFLADAGNLHYHWFEKENNWRFQKNLSWSSMKTFDEIVSWLLFISNLQHPLAKCEFNGCELYMNLSYIFKYIHVVIWTITDIKSY